MNFIVKHKVSALIFTVFFAFAAASAWADCPTHATYPVHRPPRPNPPTNPNGCEGDGDTSQPPLDTPTEPGGPPAPDFASAPFGFSGSSCPRSEPPVPNDECANVSGSPDSLPTVGERVRLHVVGGGGAVPVLWKKMICFGDGFRLNYLSYFQYTADGMYARLYDPAAQEVHNFRTDPNSAFARTEVIDGESYTVRQYPRCYRGESADMNRVTITTYTRAEEKYPSLMEMSYPEGGSLHYEFDSYDTMTGDIAGPLYRISKRVTRRGNAVTFSYSDDRLVIRDATGNEYVCHINADKRIVKIVITAGGESRSWTYAYSTRKIVETNDQTGAKMEMRGDSFVTDTIITGPDRLPYQVAYSRDTKGNLTSMSSRGVKQTYSVVTMPNSNIQHAVVRGGNVTTREYGPQGLVSRVNALGEREEFAYDKAKRLTYYKNALGHEWHHEYSEDDWFGMPGMLIRSRFPDGGEREYDYYPDTDLLSEKRIKLEHLRWQTVSYSYDDQQDLVEERRQLEGGAVGITRYVRRPGGTVSYMLVKADDSRWAVTYHEYDAANQPILVKGPYYVLDPEHPEIGLPSAGRTYAYDAWGNLISDTDALGNATVYEYDNGNRMTARINPLGHRTEYVYDGLGQLVKQTDALGNQTQWTYANGRITSVKGGAGAAGCGACALAAGTADKPGAYVWNSSGLLASFKDLEDNITQYEYDAAERKSKEIDPLGNVTRYGYDSAGNLTSVTDPMGKVTRYGYDAMGRRVSTTDPLGNVSGAAYDLAGRAVGMYDAAGGGRTMEYGIDGRLYASRTIVNESTWRETRYAYNLRGDLVEMTEADGVTRFEYAASGLPSKTITDPHGLNIVEEMVYDAAGRLTQRIDGNGNATLFAYDAGGNLVMVTSPEGRKTAFVYDEVGRRVEAVLDPDGIAQTQYITYDAAGQVAEESDGVSAQSYTYDKVGRRTGIIIPGQQDVTMIYDAAGRLVETRRLHPDGTLAMSVTHIYDNAGRVTATTDEAGKVTQYSYDAAGRLAKVTDPLGAETQYEYDAAGRGTKVILPHGGERVSVYNLAGELVRSEGGAEGMVEYYYDAMGRPTETMDANGHSRRTYYDLAGRVTRMDNEMGQPVIYTYDNAGNRLSLTDANSNITVFEYDRDGNLLAMIYPPVPGQPENIERYQYDAAGRLLCKTTPNGDDIRYLYDPAGNVEALYHGAAVADAASIPADRLIARYERNGTGVVTKEEDSNTAMLYSFDIFGRLTESRDRTLEKSVRYAYDARGLRTGMEVVDYTPTATGTVSMTVAYGYDDAGRLKTVKKDNDPAAVYEYDLSGRRIGLTLPNGVSTGYTYDSADRLLDLTTKKDETVLAKFAYTLDPTGNRTGITYADGSRSLYEFDTAYRLTRDLRVDASNETLYDEAYTYDAVGNRLTKVRTGWNPVHAINTYNARNQLVSTTGSESKTYSYDANGNTIAITSGRDVESMEYDVLSRMTRYSGARGTTETAYRGSEWHRARVSEQISGESEANAVSFLYDADDVVADYAGDDTTLAVLYVTPFLDENMSIARQIGEDRGVYYYTHDGLGSVYGLVNQSASIVNQYDYTAFGEFHNILENSSLMGQRYGYAGRENHSIMKGMNNRYRNYFTTLGRFDRRDPSGYINNMYLNLYDYVYSSPIEYDDPFGMNGKRKGKKGGTSNKRYWEGYHIPAIECLNWICDDLPPAQNPDCPEQGSREKCKQEAVEVAANYVETMRQSRSESCVSGYTGWSGNFASSIAEARTGDPGVGCSRLQLDIQLGFGRLKSQGGFNVRRESGHMTPASLKHRWIVYSYRGSSRECATTVWETGSGTMKKYPFYEYYQSFYKEIE